MTLIPGSVLSPERIDRILEFVKESTKHFDESHNVHHAICVMMNVLRILTGEKQPYEEDVVILSSLLYDVRDAKYGELSITREALETFLLQEVGGHVEKQRRILKIIDNISWSKEVAGKRQPMDSQLDQYHLDVVSDADRLEAIGEVGVQRCIQFTLARNGQVPKDVVQHCHDKLLRIASEFIKTQRGKELAQPLHQVIVDYVTQNS